MGFEGSRRELLQVEEVHSVSGSKLDERRKLVAVLDRTLEGIAEIVGVVEVVGIVHNVDKRNEQLEPDCKKSQSRNLEKSSTVTYGLEHLSVSLILNGAVRECSIVTVRVNNS